MTPRKLHQLDWNSWSFQMVTNFVNRCQYLIYSYLCVLAYSLVRDMLPGRWPEIFLVIVLLCGISGGPWDQPRGKVATLIRGLLRQIAKGIIKMT